MTQRTFLQILTIVGVAVLVGTVSWTVMVADGGSGGEGWVARLHPRVHVVTDEGSHHGAMDELLAELELTPEQLGQFEKFHRLLESYGDAGHGSMAELHEELLRQLEAGRMETPVLRKVVDGHVESLRQLGYSVTDEAGVLVGTLDERQRRTILEHVRARHGEPSHAR